MVFKQTLVFLIKIHNELDALEKQIMVVLYVYKNQVKCSRGVAKY
jgi:hypothetical protein